MQHKGICSKIIIMLLLLATTSTAQLMPGQSGILFNGMTAVGTCTVCGEWSTSVKSAGINITGTHNTIATAINILAARCGIGTVSKTVGPGAQMWYWEVTPTGGTFGEVGVGTSLINTGGPLGGGGGNSWGYTMQGLTYFNGGTVSPCTAACVTFSAGDTMCLALDAVNGAVYIRKKNGSWINGGNPLSGAARTGAIFTFTAGTTIFAGYGSFDSGTGNFSCSGDFGLNLRYTAPAGYNRGLY